MRNDIKSLKVRLVVLVLIDLLWWVYYCISHTCISISTLTLALGQLTSGLFPMCDVNLSFLNFLILKKKKKMSFLYDLLNKSLLGISSTPGITLNAGILEVNRLRQSLPLCGFNLSREIDIKQIIAP